MKIKVTARTSRVRVGSEVSVTVEVPDSEPERMTTKEKEERLREEARDVLLSGSLVEWGYQEV